MRKYPPVALLLRKGNQDYKVSGTNHTIPKGMHVLIPIYAIHHDTRHYQNPDVFDPERFSTEEVETRHHYSFLPFGEGKRICIGEYLNSKIPSRRLSLKLLPFLGMRFGMLEAKFGIAQIILKYKLKLNAKTNTPLKINPKTITLEDENGVWIDFEEIS